MPLSAFGGGLSKSDLENSSYDFLHLGIAISNPSSNTDLFASDEFSFAGQSVKYDTMRRHASFTAAIVSEPSAALLLCAGLLSLIRRRKRN